MASATDCQPSPRRLLFSQNSIDAIIAHDMSSWRLQGPQTNPQDHGAVNLMHVLQCDRVSVMVGTRREDANPDNFFKHMENVSFESEDTREHEFQSYLDMIDRAMMFDIKDLVNTAQFGDAKKITLYAGYSEDACKLAQKDALCDLLQSHENTLQLQQQYRKMDGTPEVFIHLTGNGIDFIEEVISFIKSPGKQTEQQTYEHLFTSFANIVELKYRPAATEPSRIMNIYGKEVHGKADLRSLSSLPELKYDSEGGQLQVLNKILKLQERVTSVVEVKTHAMNTEDTQAHIDGCLAQLLAKMLGELRDAGVPDPVGASRKFSTKEMIGLAVMSTRVQFVLLRMPNDVSALYNERPERCFEDPVREKSVLYVTNWLDYMKPKHRHVLLKMLYKLTTISSL